MIDKIFKDCGSFGLPSRLSKVKRSGEIMDLQRRIKVPVKHYDGMFCENS